MATVKRALGRNDRRIDIGGLPARDFADFNPARRVLDRQALPRLRRDPTSVDEVHSFGVGNQVDPGETRELSKIAVFNAPSLI